MSAAVLRAIEREKRNKESTQPAETVVTGKLEDRPVIEVSKVTEADCHTITDHGMTPLMRAASEGLAGTVQALIDLGAEVNAKRSDGLNALALATFFGHSRVVWLLLQNGADLAATGRSETELEMWADARGFVDIGDMFREARATRQVESSSPRTAVIDEPGRFPRPAEKEDLQQAGGPAFGVGGAVIDAGANSDAALTKPVPVAEESTATKSQPSVNIFPSDKPDHTRQRHLIKQTRTAVKTLPEIVDPPPLVAPAFHPTSAFVTRITSSRKNLVVLMLAMLLVCGGIAAFLIPQIRKSIADRRAEAFRNPSNLAAVPNGPAAPSETNASGRADTPSAATTLPNTPASNNIAKTTSADSLAETANAKNVESTSRFAEVSEKDSEGAAEDKRVSAVMSISRSAARTRRQRAVSQPVKFKQQTTAEEQPKPAPLSVETSRSNSVVPTPARSANDDLDRQPQPSSVISAKPKSKSSSGRKYCRKQVD